MKQNPNDQKLLLKESTRRDFILHGLSFLKNLFLFQMMFSNIFSRTSFNLLKSETFLSQTITESEEDINHKISLFYDSLIIDDEEDISIDFEYLYIRRDLEYLKKMRSQISFKEATEMVILDILKDPFYYFFNLPSEEYIYKHSLGVDIVFSDFVEENDFSTYFKEELSRLINEKKVDENFLNSSNYFDSYHGDLLISSVPNSSYKYLCERKVSNQPLLPYKKERSVFAYNYFTYLGLQALSIITCCTSILLKRFFKT